MTQYEPAARAANLHRSPTPYVVAVEITVQAWTSDEAAQVVQGFLTNVFARPEYEMGKVYRANTEPPDDETWCRALDWAGALG